jgi:hypothetical protein
MAAAGTGFLVLALLATLLPAPPVAAQNACSAQCRSAYGSCYKSSQDRPKCQAQLQRCLEACIRNKR